MFRRVPLAETIRGQITVLILLALVTVTLAGGPLVRMMNRDSTMPSLEYASNQVTSLALTMRSAPATERDAILRNARAAGLQLSLAHASIAGQFKPMPGIAGKLTAVADFLFPPDGEPPIGGWRTYLAEHRVIAARVDDDTLLLMFGFPDGVLTRSQFGQGLYYFIATVVLMTFFFIFAITTITRPIKRISEAAARLDLNDDNHTFQEQGPREIIALAKALNAMRSRISLMVAARTNMLRGISHDLRTPLTRIRLRAERMAEGPIRDAFLVDADRIDRLLTESLNYLRDEYATENVERVDVASILQTVCSEFCDVGFQIRYQGPHKLIAHCRPLSITRAVTNLCDNSVKFAKSADVRLAQDPNGFTVSVLDDGPGIPAALHEKVFEPFFKADTARNDTRTGFGLGLSIVAEVVRSHHGSIELQPRLPHGLIVTMSVPATGNTTA